MSGPLAVPMAIARRGAQLLYRLGARRVWICGSLARGGPWDDRSDVDFAVEGLPGHRLVEARGLLARLTTRAVNVVVLEEVPANLRAAIVAHRILVDPDGSEQATPAVPAGPVESAVAVSGSAGLQPRRSWHERRLASVAGVLTERGARRVVDLGCGTGRLIELMLRDGVDRVTGVDRDAAALAAATARLDAALPPTVRERCELRHGVLWQRDEALRGHDAAVAVEVIEHLDPAELDGFVDVVFALVRPATVVVTTPNAEFNGLLRTVDLRHPEHRFEWTRMQFRAWSRDVAAAHGYAVSVRPLGRPYPAYGSATQLGVFTR